MLNIVPRNRAFHLIQLCCQLLRQGRVYAVLVAVLLLATPFSSVQAANDAAPFGTQTVPANMVVGEAYQIVIPMRNTGTVPWTVAGKYSLVLQSPGGWNVTQISVGSTIGVNVTKSFVASVTAPSTPGVYNFQWCMDQNGAQFGACSTPVAINVASRVQDAQFYATSMTSQLVSPTRVISVSMKNTGNVPWKAGQYSMGTSDTTWGITKLTLSANVPPNAIGAFSGTITAPEPGTYKMQWQMRGPDGNSFGAPSTALDVAVAGGPPTLDVRSPTPSQPFIGNANVILVPIHAEATPTGIATISKVAVEVFNPNSQTYQVLATANGPVLDQTLRLGSYPTTLVFIATDSFNKSVSKPVSIVALNDNAQITAMNFPASMVPGQRYNISITAKNVGGTTWDPKTTKLVPYNAAQISNWGDFSLPLSGPVPPGGTAVFSATVTTPANEGTVGFQMIMNEATRANFGGVAGRLVTVAHPPPTVEMTTPLNRDSVDIPANTKAQVRVQGSATPGLGASITKLELLNNNTTVLLTLFNTATVDQLVELPAGVHQLRLRATDNWNKVTYGAIATYTVLSNNATASSQIVQATMQAGKSYSTTVTMQNSGSKPWTAAAGYALVSRHPEQWGIARVAPTAAVGAGAAYTFSVPVTAPSVAGTYDYQWSMVQDGVEAFGEPSKIVRVVVNPVAPSVPGLVAPEAGAKFLAVGTKADVRVQGSARAGEGATIGKLEVLDGATVIATANAGTIDMVVQLAGGAHALRLRATDNFNQVTTGTVITTVTVLVNGASATSRIVPSPMVGGSTYPVTVVMRNSGTSTWTPADGYVLAPVVGNPNWVAAPIPVPSAVAPGTDATFAFNVTAPADPATYPFQWKLSQNGNEFGTASVVVNVTVTGLPPKVALSAPLDGTVYTAANGSSQFTVQGSASATGSATISQFTLLDNGVARINGAGNAFDKVVVLTPGKHVLQLRATDSRGAVTLSNTSTVNVLHNDASLSSPSVPATMFAGQRYTLAIMVKNTGDTTWQPVSAPAQGGVALAELPNNGGVWRPDGRVQLNKAVAPGETYTFNFDVVAPATAGTYGFQWRMSDESKELFGTQITTSIVVAQAPVPTATLTASPVNQRVAPGQMGSIALTGRASEASGKLSKLEVFVDSGSGYAASPVKAVSGSTSQLDLNDSISLPSGSYRLKLRVTDDGGRYADSAPVAVNVTDSPLLGLVSGVRSSGGQQLHLVGWTCRDASAEALSYQVYINAPANLGGTPVASGVANVGSELDDAAIQQTCHTPGISHHFAVDLSSLLTQYPGAPLYVSASSTHGERIVLPCEDHGCRIPEGMRIGLTSPNVNNLDRFRLPNPVFARALVAGNTGAVDEVAFNIEGQWVPGVSEGGGAYSVSKAGLAARAAPYVAYAKVRQGDTTVITDEHAFYVDAGPTPGTVSPPDGSIVALNQPMVLSTVINGTVLPGQSVKFFIDPKTAQSWTTQAGRQLMFGGPLGAALAGGTVNPAGTSAGSVVGDATFDGAKWVYTWNPTQAGSYAVVAKLLDAAGTVLMQTPAATLTVSGGSDPGTGTTGSSVPLPVILNVPHLSNRDAGTLPGSLDVDANGAATYSIPIAVPPGSGGMQPSLALNYSSSGTNGIAGLGWSLSGLSTIHRCAKTIAQDGVTGRLSFDNADRLCLDGQRLVRADGAAPGSDVNAIDAAYWAPGAQYRTELESFVFVTRLDSGGFKAESKDGHIRYFGIDGASAIPASGLSGQVLLWALARTEDRSGNYMSVSYNYDASTGEYTPKKIRYGGNTAAGTAMDLAVTFTYETEARGDAKVQYLGGARNDLQSRLHSVNTYINTAVDGSGGTLVRTHTINYIYSVSSGRSLVASMQACAINLGSGVSACLPATQFTWGQETVVARDAGAIVLPVKNTGLGTGELRYEGDFDGNGKREYLFPTVVTYCPVDPSCVPIPTDDGHGNENQPISYLSGDFKIVDATGASRVGNLVFDGKPFPHYEGLMVVDLNGDGRDDVVLTGHGGQLTGYCLNDDTPTMHCYSFPAVGTIPAGVTQYPIKGVTVVDMMRSGKMHVIDRMLRDCSLVDAVNMQCAFVDAVNVTDPELHYANPLTTISFSPSFVDFSKQGMSDLYSIYDPVVGPGVNQIEGVANCVNKPAVVPGTLRFECRTAYQWQDATPVLRGAISIGDLNADGLSDYVFAVKGGDIFVCLGKENGVDCQSTGQASWIAAGNDLVDAYIGDFLGDGTSTLLIRQGSSYTDNRAVTLCRMGSQYQLICQNVSLPDLTGYSRQDVQDIDGTGIPQLWYIRTADIGMHPDIFLAQGKAVSLALPAKQDKLVAVVNGIGYREEVEYARSDDGAVYSRFANISGTQVRPVYPQLSTAPGSMAKVLRRSNGKGGWLTRDYHYEGAMRDGEGRGSLGFGIVKSLDPDRHMLTTTTYKQAWPYTGMVASATVAHGASDFSGAGGVMISNTLNFPTSVAVAQANGATTVCPLIDHSSVDRWDLDGSQLGNSATANQYTDGWCNLTQQTVTLTPPGGGGQFVTQTNTTYLNDVTARVAGLPTQVAVKKTDPVSGSVTRTMAYTYDQVPGLLHTETIEPGDAWYRVITTYDRSTNKYGLLGTKTQAWQDPACVNNTVTPACAASKTRTVSDVAYDAQGRFPYQVRNALGHLETHGYDAATGARTSLTGPNNLTTHWTVDGFGRVTKEMRADGNETRSYLKECQDDCPPGAVLAQILDNFHGADRISVPTVVYSDDAGHVLRTTSWGFDGRQIDTDQRYDSLGRHWETDQPRFDSDTTHLASRQLYDDLDRVIEIDTIDEAGATQRSTTAYQGLTRVLTNAKNQTRTETRDVAGQLVQVLAQDAVTNLTLFGYEPFGGLSKTTDPNGNVISVVYDRLGRKTELHDPDLGFIQYSVDPLGQTWKQVSPKQRAALQASYMVYDLLGRMTARYEPDLESHWVFDQAIKGVGQLNEAYTVAGGVKDYDRTHAFDDLGRPSQTTQLLSDGSYTSQTAYDLWGRVINQTHQRKSDAAKVFDTRYNNYGYLTQVQRGELVLWKATAQDAAGRPRTIALGNGLTDTIHYNDNTGRLDSAVLSMAAGAPQLQESYQYDVLGSVSNRTQYWGAGASQLGFSEDFTYDQLNRLWTSQIHGQPKLTFTYDAAGNILTKTGTGTGAYIYPAQGATAVQPHAVQSITGIDGSFIYDPNGNQTVAPNRAATWTSFDMPQQLVKGVVASSFVYGPEHQRTRQDRSDGSKMVYAGAQEVETKGTQVMVKTYWPMGIGVEIENQTAGTTALNWVHHDRLGSPIAITDQGGTLQESLAYDAWGKRRALTGNSTPDTLDGVIDNKGYTGHEMLDQLDLVHMNGRVYDPYTVKFLSGDPLIAEPVNGQNYNRYSYVLNNPTNLTDPTGFRQDDREKKKIDWKGLEELRRKCVTGCVVQDESGTSPVFYTKSSSGTASERTQRSANNAGSNEYPGKGWVDSAVGFVKGLFGIGRVIDGATDAAAGALMGRDGLMHSGVQEVKDAAPEAMVAVIMIVGKKGGGAAVVDAAAARAAATGAEGANAAAALASKLSALESAQASAARVRVLPDGRIRYYEAERPARTAGPSRGSSYVTEWNPANGNVRSWNEVYDQAGEVNRVHPKMINGQTVDSLHYPPTAKELGGQ